MPKVVDRDERRHTIVAAAWRLIAARGIDGVNMRDLAAEAGYTNGALSRYFSGKDEILRAAFELVLEETNTRIERSVRTHRGLKALRKVCVEIMPLTEETRLEARIAISLWQRALTDRDMEKANNDIVGRWSARIAAHLTEAVEDGTLIDIDVEVYASLIMTTVVGLQVTAVLGHPGTSRKAQLALLDAILDGHRVTQKV
ncbi:TetR/AcrR family transcriptional regulator [Rhodococcus fascians]|nr:TetR/AcrR family transcriptional regulator [Rhodococcus fascians]